MPESSTAQFAIYMVVCAFCIGIVFISGGTVLANHKADVIHEESGVRDVILVNKIMKCLAPDGEITDENIKKEKIDSCLKDETSLKIELDNKEIFSQSESDIYNEYVKPVRYKEQPAALKIKIGEVNELLIT